MRDRRPGNGRARLRLRHELLLALLPTATVLAVFGLVEAFSQQRLLFVSLASSAFLIYLDPQHGTNSMRTLVVAQLSAAALGVAALALLGPGYAAGGAAMVAVIVLMVALDVVHPPAVSTALSFAFRDAAEDTLTLFALAVGLVALLVALEHATLWLLGRLSRRSRPA